MDGLLVLDAAHDGGRTRIARVRYEGTARASRAFEDARGTRVVVSTLGPGSLGGDRLRIEGRVGTGAHLVITAQSATRAYGPGCSWLDATWHVAEGATLELHAEPILLFADADYRSRTEIVLARNARLWTREVIGLGEPCEAHARLSTIVWRDAKLTLRDALAIDRSTLDGGAVGSLIAYGYDIADTQTQTAGVRTGVGSTLDGGIFLRATGAKVWDVLQEAARRL